MNPTPPSMTPPPLPHTPEPPPEPTTLLGRLLRTPQSLVVSPDDTVPLRLFALGLGGSLVYGLVLASFSAGPHWWVPPLKLALGLLAALALCAPSLFVFASLAGARLRARDVLVLLAGLHGLASLLLLSLAPVAWVFSQSTQSAGFIGTLHWLFWIVAAGFGLRLVGRGLRLLGGGSAGAFGVWSLLFLFVCFQMATSLRPLLSDAAFGLPAEKKSFLSHWGDVLSAGESKSPRP